MARARVLAILSALLATREPLSAQQATTGTTAPRLPRVVFVCEHGTVKSLVALEYFNRLALERGLRTQAISRGTNPDSAIPSPVRRGLESDGFDLGAFQPRKFTQEDLTGGALVVALDANVESVVGRRLPVVRWDGLPSVTADYPAARTAIVARVRRLVDSLARAKQKR